MQTRSNISQVKLSRRAPRHGSYRCCLELLEDRCLPASGLSASLVADIVPGSSWSNPTELVNVNGTLFFGAASGLWKSDGTTSGTVRVSADPLLVANLVSAGGKLFFSGLHADTGRELWVSDGTASGTRLVKDIFRGTHQECVALEGCFDAPNSSSPDELANVNGTVYFAAADGRYGRELWKSNGTGGGTKLVQDINRGRDGSDPREPTVVGGTLFFVANSSTAAGLWKTDGKNVVLVKQIGAQGLTNVNGTLFFLTVSSADGFELWKSDGTAAGTVLVKSINPAGDLDPGSFTNVNGTLFFQVNDGIHGRELWRSDGTTGGTVLVKDINPDSAGSFPTDLTNVNGTLYFIAGDGTNGRELWKSDGTAAGTVLVRDIAPNSASAFVPADGLTTVNGLLYFPANDGDHGRELWQSDGTAAGTVMVHDIYPGSGSSDPAYLTAMNNRLYFAATDPVHGRELWDPPPVSSVEVLNDFAGLAFDPNVPRFPPNPSLAVGPHHVVEVVIGGIAFFDKETGARVFAQRDADFFAPAGVSANLNDPKASYDELAGRFIVTAREVNRAARTAHLLIAVSDDADPNGGWEMHAIDVSHNGEHFADFPQLGWDADAIYLSANMGTFQSGNGFVELTTIEKASLLDGDSTTITYYTTQRKWPHVTMQPAIMHGANAGDPMYFVEALQLNPGNHLLVVRMTNKLSPEPTFTEFKITVPKYNDPPAATQADGEELDTNFTWILSAAWRGGRLVASQNVGANGHKEARARWYEFDTLGAEPLLVQSGEIDPGPGVHTYYPAIDIAPNGDLGMSFMQSSSTEFLSMYVTGRSTADPLGTMQTPVLVKAGEATYATNRPDIDPPPLRAGDHSGIGIDPIDGTFWAVSQYATPPLPPSAVTANWGTWIANFSIDGGNALPAQSLGTRSVVEPPLLGQDREADGRPAEALTAGTRRVPSSDSDPFVATVLDRVFADSKSRLASPFINGSVLRILLNLTKYPDGKARVWPTV